MTMEIDEVIEELKYMISEDCTDTQMDFVEEIEFAIQLLEKQVSKLIKTNGKYMKDFRIEPCDQVFCPNCGKRLRVKYKGKFCDKCGQKLKWSDNNED